jgi:hypothetical protein
VRRLVYLAAAQRDLVSILEYITRESGSVAIGAASPIVSRRTAPSLPRCPAHSVEHVPSSGLTSAARPSGTT